MEIAHLTNAKIFKAFSDENRLMVLSLLHNGEQCAHDLLEQVNIVQSTLSHHMKVLVESGIVTARKEGKWTYYSICPSGCKKAADLLNGLISNIADIPQTKNQSNISHINVVPKKSVAVRLM